jgi:lipoprotein NlpD
VHRPQVISAGAAPSSYLIRSGDTLYSIAWRYGLDFKRLAALNGINPPYLIYAGQRLRLHAPAGTHGPTADRVPQVSRGAQNNRITVKSSHATTPSSTVENRSSPTHSAPLRWRWPAQGRVAEAETALGQKGINILGTMGEPVLAAAAGEVVYSGSGLIGYGKLIIIRHDDVYLSAYAHNEKLLVKEGTKVSGGQKIAEMGRSGTKQVMLHFEIRRNGKPVPPLSYLPNRPH